MALSFFLLLLLHTHTRTHTQQTTLNFCFYFKLYVLRFPLRFSKFSHSTRHQKQNHLNIYTEFYVYFFENFSCCRWFKKNNKKRAPTHTRTRQKNTDAEKSGTDNRQMLRFSSACLFSVRPQVCLSKRRSRNSLIAANRSP